MIKKLAFAILATVAIIALPSCENNGNDDKGGKDNVIVLDRQVNGYYLGKVWDFQGEEHADYYFTLGNCEVGQSVQTGYEVPMEVGGWLLFLDLWAEASENTANAVIPEGEYIFSDRRDMYIVYDQYTVASQNIEQVGNQFRIRDRRFTGGTVNVSYNKVGGYIIEATLTTIMDDEEVELIFKYEGPIVLEDQSDDEPWEPGMNEDINVNPVQATVAAYAENDTVDSYVVRLFDTSISDDGTHPAAPGHMIMLDLYTAEGADFAGDYRPGTMNGSTMTKEPGVFYPGKFWGGMALGSVIERVYPDMTTESDVLVDGSVEIRNLGGSNYAIRVNMTTGNGYKVNSEYTGVVNPFSTTSTYATKRPAEVNHTGFVKVR